MSSTRHDDYVPPKANRWFQPGDGIAREVITADIQRWLGPDALVKPGHHNVRALPAPARSTVTDSSQGQSGYWITAYRTFTSVPPPLVALDVAPESSLVANACRARNRRC